MKPIIFLDYDGVVNTMYWCSYPSNPNHSRGTFRCDYAHPHDGFVNNFQAICWLNELYEKIPYDIVVTSTWRKHSNYKDCLYNGGLNKEILIDKTPWLGTCRKDEILAWIEQNNYCGEYIIIDDENIEGLEDSLIKCLPYSGIIYKEFSECQMKLSLKLKNKSRVL